MTDFRALCAELVEAWDNTSDFDYNDFGNAAADIVIRARAALAQPEPQEPPYKSGGLMELTKENLIWVLCSIMDGMKAHEIHEITGLPQDACEKVWAVYCQALREPCARPH